VGKGVIDFPKFGKKNGILLRNDRSRIGNFHSTNDAFPGGILADEILTPGKRQIRALFVTGGNPLITMANSNRLREAFQKLDLLVTLDIYPNETGSIGHYMLPCTSPLERPDLPFIFPLMLGLQAKPYLQATKALVKPEGEQRDEASIYLDLCKASGVNLFGSVIAQRFMATAARLHGKKLGGKRTLPQEWILNLLMKVTRQPGFKKLLKSPHGVLRPDHKPGSFLGKRVLTEDGKVQLAHPMLMEEANKLELHFEREKAAKNTFKLITKRAVTTHNSWTHNYDDFVKGDRYTNFLYIHPKDAEKLGIEERELVDVSTETGKVRIPVKFLSDLMPGTVALPHGWGHQHSNLETASKTQGVNVNILAADGPDRIERVSGMANLTGFPVHIEKSRGKVYPTWSGLKEDDLSVAKVSEKS
jgi:formate dehydrogenase